LGLDMGIVTGELKRTEAFRATPGGAFGPCTGVLNPAILAPSGTPYCNVALRNGVPVTTNNFDELGEQYGVIETRVPPVALMPALPEIALRFTPHRNVAIKLEAAYGVFQFWFGLSAAYGLDL